MKKFLSLVIGLALAFGLMPTRALAAGGIYASGGGTKTIGTTFTVYVTASGATFDTVHGSISVSGPVSVVSFSPGSATWISQPSNGGTFDGAFLGQKQTSFTVATIKLKGTAAGSGAVSVSGVSLKNAGNVVGTDAGGTNFTIQKAPELPGAVAVSSTSHPDQNTAYEATTIALSWDKASGVDGFSYLLDQTADTTPAAKTTDANTSVSYADKAVGVYYFHIRAHKPDGWGSTTHFKISIKEPDPKINESLGKPNDIKIVTDSTAIDDVLLGTLAGITISGKTEAGFTANIKFDPAPTVPEGKSLSILADASGKFTLPIGFPLKAGFYKLTIQGQKDKVLTPVSDEIRFEISLKEGGNINIITDKDSHTPATPAEKAQSFLDKSIPLSTLIYIVLGLVILGLIVVMSIRFLRNRKIPNIK